MSTPVCIDRPRNRFIDPKVLISIQNMELVARTVVEGFVTGLHRSPYLGFSVDFAEYRQYMPGDEIRRIDWNVYGRSGQALHQAVRRRDEHARSDPAGYERIHELRIRRGQEDRLRADAGRVPDVLCISPARWRRPADFRYGVRSHIPASRRTGQLLHASFTRSNTRCRRRRRSSRSRCAFWRKF